MLYNETLYNWVNVILRYGILQGKLFKMSIQELHNRYTDGKKKSGAPLSKYFTSISIFFQTSKSQLKSVLKRNMFFHSGCRQNSEGEKLIPNRFHTFIWARLGFLFTVAKKGDLCQADTEYQLKNFINIGYFIKF